MAESSHSLPLIETRLHEALSTSRCNATSINE
jgi:hypothetical protein